MRYTALAMSALCALVASAVQAQNLVVDPGFESAAPGLHLAGNSGAPFPAAFGDGAWTTTQGGVSITNASALAHSGNNALDLSPGNSGAVTQTLATLPGQAYDLSFFAESNFAANTFNVTFDGLSVFSQALPRTGLGTANYRLYTVSNLFASTSSTVLTFAANGGNENADVFLDDVSVVRSPAAVPEPGSFALLTGMTLTGAAFLRRRCKKAHKAA